MSKQRALLPTLVLLGLAACNYHRDDYPSSPADYAAYMDSLSTTTPTVSADGFSSVQITAPLKDPGPGLAVVFTTTAGHFSGRKDRDTAEVPVASNGTASVELISPTHPDTARVNAQVKSVPKVMRSVTIPFVAPVLDDILRFESVPDSVPADGASRTAIVVATAPALFDGTRTVTFRTTQGSFLESGASTAEVVIAQDHRAEVHLVSPSQTGTATVTASVEGFSRTQSIPITPALPQSLVLDAGAFTIPAGSTQSITVTAHLRRIPGQVSPGVQVQFAATDSLGHDIGSFRAIQPSDQAGDATAKYTAGDTQYRGPVRIRASVPGTMAAGEATVTVVNP